MDFSISVFFVKKKPALATLSIPSLKSTFGCTSTLNRIKVCAFGAIIFQITKIKESIPLIFVFSRLSLRFLTFPTNFQVLFGDR